MHLSTSPRSDRDDQANNVALAQVSTVSHSPLPHYIPAQLNDCIIEMKPTAPSGTSTLKKNPFL